MVQILLMQTIETATEDKNHITEISYASIHCEHVFKDLQTEYLKDITSEIT